MRHSPALTRFFTFSFMMAVGINHRVQIFRLTMENYADPVTQYVQAMPLAYSVTPPTPPALGNTLNLKRQGRI
jgi:hypothetical protein